MTDEATEDPDDATARGLDDLLVRAMPPLAGADDLGNALCISMIRGRLPPMVGDYELLETIGGGSYGEVIRCRSRTMKREVALKRLKPSVNGPAKAHREAVALASMNHPNVVTVHDVLQHGDEVLIVMELVEGESLRRWQTAASYDAVLDAYLQAGEGLSAMHTAGLLHLDFKPDNVLRGSDGRVRVADLGFARRIEELPTQQTRGAPTHSAVPPGTLGYVAPEQAEGTEVDARADQHAFCKAMREALVSSRTRKPSGRVEAALLRGVSVEPADRWPSMRELLDELRRPPWWQRRLFWALAGATIFALPTALAYATSAPACAAARDRLAQRWDARVRGEIANAFTAGGAAWSERALATVERDIDAYATRWARDVDAACPATSRHPPAVTAAQLACLDRALDRLGRTTTLLAAGQESVIEHADDVVRQLTPLDRCQPAAGNGVAATTDEVADAIAEAENSELRLAAGMISEARDSAERAVLLARRTHDPSALGSALFARGTVLDELGLDAEAVVDLEEAAAHGIAAHDASISARAWQALVLVTAYDLEDETRAAQWLRLAEAAIVGLDNPPLLRAEAFDVRGTYEELRRDLVASEQAYRAALAELKEHVDEADPRWTRTWTNLAGVRLQQGDIEEARTLMERVVDRRTTRLGPEHPDVAEALRGLAMVARSQGETEESFRLLQRAESIFVEALGPTSKRLAPVLTALAQLHLGRAELGRAADFATRAWAIQRASLPITHSERAEGALLLLLDIAEMRGDYDALLRLAAERRAEASARKNSLEVAHVDNDIAWTLCQLKRYDDARPIYAGLRTHDSKDPLVAGLALAGLGFITLSTGDPASAVPQLEQALIEVQALPDTEDQVAEIRLHLAQALDLVGGASERVRELAISALRYYRSTEAIREVEVLLQILERNP